MNRVSATVSIIIPVFNKVAFTRQCLDRLALHPPESVNQQVIVVDNGSSDETAAVLTELSARDPAVVYLRNDANLGFSRGNNVGAQLATGRYLLFLNNDTIVQPGWLDAMVRVIERDERVGIVGIKQLFPYTNRIHHTGIIFTADRRPQHIYPHADASVPFVNKQREYQAVTGSCLLIPRDLFVECGMFDEGYKNGYEDIDLCLTVRDRGRKVVCCTDRFIYHYGQITETRTADDDANLARFMARWGDRVQPDELSYFRADEAQIAAAAGRTAP
jgi:O-antigen biosynthesis protein